MGQCRASLRWPYVDQAANAKDATVNLAPTDPSLVDGITANYTALLPWQDVPLIWERYTPDTDDDWEYY